MTGPLIGLVGRKRSGKDTAAARLIERGFVRYAFADPLRALMLELNPCLPPVSYPGDLAPLQPVRLATYVEALGWERAKENPEVRRLLQAHGDAARRLIGEGVWREPVMRRIGWEPAPVVVTDVRYPDEAEAIREIGGILVRIVRPGRDDGDRHPSEIGLDEWPCDVDIVNAGTVADLHTAIDDMLSSWFPDHTL